MKASKLTTNQVKTFRGEYTEGGHTRVVVASVRYDDQCGNGHNTFSITGMVYGPHGCARDGVEKTADGKRVTCESCGCVHDDIARAIPALAPFIKWHLCSSDGPMHYPDNALFLSGTRDCHGLDLGEFRQHTSRGSQNDGIAGVPLWELEKPKTDEMYADEVPAPVVLEWKASGRTGEGKARELDAAREAAIWPDATDAELSIEPDKLRAVLMERLPGLIDEFRAEVESLGFEW